MHDPSMPLAVGPTRDLPTAPLHARTPALRARVAVAVVLLYLLLLVLFDGLGFPVRKDEVHFWPTSLRFSHSLVPDLEVLRNYGELNTPLPFLLFGALEYLFHGGIQIARLVNLTLAFAVLLVLCADASGRTLREIAAPVVGVLLVPYFYLVSLHAYTDVLGIFWVVVGLALHFRGRFAGAAVAFVLAIAARQYMVAFPAALAIHGLVEARRAGSGVRAWAWLFPLAAAGSLLGWYLFFGGFGPQGEVAAQGITTVEGGRLLPRNGLYFLAALGLYFVVPERVLRARRVPLRGGGTARGLLGIAGVLALLFLLFPPLHNTDFPIPTMGYLDRGLRAVVGDPLRVGVFYLLALLAVLRFRRPDLAFWIVLVNTLLMMKAHIAWDKYALPVVVALWYLSARAGADSSSSESDVRPNAGPHPA